MYNLQRLTTAASSALYSLGDIIADRLLRSLRAGRADFDRTRATSGVIHILMHVSDCARYVDSTSPALRIAQLIRVLSPSEPEAHMRIGLCAPLGGLGLLRAFFHFCVFLDNRHVPVTHPEATVVYRAVSAAQKALDDSASGQSLPLPARFAARFVAAVWAVLTSEPDTALAAAGSTALWADLEKLLAAGSELQGVYLTPAPAASGVDADALQAALLHVAGVAIFARQRAGGSRAESASRVPAADGLLGRLLCTLAASGEAGMRVLASTARRRRKNRTRHLQRKRKRAGGGPCPVPALGVLQGSITTSGVPVALGPLSKLTHFWAKSACMPSDAAHSRQFAQSSRAITKLDEEMDVFARAARIDRHLARTASAMVAPAVAGGPGIPALPEDAVLCAPQACVQRGLLRGVDLPQVPPASLLLGPVQGVLRRAVEALHDTGYEKLVEGRTRKSLELFGTRLVKQIDANAVPPAADAAVALATFAIRSPRLARLPMAFNAFPTVRAAVKELQAAEKEMAAVEEAEKEARKDKKVGSGVHGSRNPNPVVLKTTVQVSSQ